MTDCGLCCAAVDAVLRKHPNDVMQWTEEGVTERVQDSLAAAHRALQEAAALKEFAGELFQREAWNWREALYKAVKMSSTSQQTVMQELLHDHTAQPPSVAELADILRRYERNQKYLNIVEGFRCPVRSIGDGHGHGTLGQERSCGCETWHRQ